MIGRYSMLFLLGALSQIFIFVDNNFSTIFFYYYIALLVMLAISLAANATRILQYFKAIKRSYYKLLLIVVFLFALLEMLFVQNYHLIYNDEYIYMSMAKTMLLDHLWGICSFSTAINCVPGTLGFFHQPGGWSLLLAIAFGIFGINIGTAYATTFAIALVSVLLIFLVSYLIFKDERYALMSSIALATMPLFMSYSRTSIPDISVLMFSLLSIMLALIYLEKRDFRIGVSALLSIAYLMTLKVDAAIIISIVAVFIITDGSWLKFNNKRAIIELAILLVIFAIVTFPQILFIHHSLQDNFGAAVGLNQSKLSVQNFRSNVMENIQFWFGAFDAVENSGVGYNNFVYHIPFPLTTTIFAITGAVGMLVKRRFREFVALFAMFGIIFIFYTSFYAGGFEYGLGVDSRYFFGDFAVIALFSGFGFVYLYDILKKSVPRFKRSHMSSNRYVLAGLFAVFMVLPVFQFITITSHSPLTMATYVGERVDENFILANYNKIPLNCTVITFQPPLWYVNGRANIYATWVNIPEYSHTLANMSKCMYFDYDLTCYVSSADGTGYTNTYTECNNMLRNYTVESIASQNYTGYSWNVTFHLYKILGRNTTK